MKNLQQFLEQAVDFERYPLARSLIPVVVSNAGISPRGYCFLQEESYRLLRDAVPHILGMGLQTIQCAEHISELVLAKETQFSKDTLENFRRAMEVVRAVVRTAAVTAPSDLWLLHHVLSGLKRHGLLEELLSGEAFELSSVELKGLLPNEVTIDLSFLSSRGIIEERDDSFYLSTNQGIRELIVGLPQTVPGGGKRLSELWSQAFREPSQFQDWDTLKEVVETIPRRERVGQDSWAPTVEEVELGYRLVPLVLGLHASGVSPRVLQSGIYFVTESSELPMEVFHGAAAILEAAGVILPQEKPLHWDLTWVGRRVLERGIGPFGIIEAYHDYMINLPQIWREGRQRVSVSRGTNIAASQLANARSFEKANDAIDKFCRATGRELRVFIEHALGRGEATRQRYERLKEEGRADECSFIGADLEDPAIDAAIEEQRSGNLPSWMKFVRRTDIGKPRLVVDALAEWNIPAEGAFMVVGNGFHEVRNQTDESITAVFKGYQDAGIIIVFTEESALLNEDLLGTAWNTYHAGFRYVHERSGQVLRPAETFSGIPTESSYRSSWAHCAQAAGYVRVREYCSRSRTIFPYMPNNGRNPAISVNHFLVPRELADEFGLLSL